jgi:hypothetical protein
MGDHRIVVVRVVPAGDLRARREPNVGVRGDVGERLIKGAEAVRPPGLEWVQRDTHDPAALGAFQVQLIELRTQDVPILAW